MDSRRHLMLVASGLLACVVTACGGSDDSPDSAAEDSASQSSDPTTTTEQPSVSPELPPTIKGAGRTTALADHLVAVRPLPGDPDWLVDAGDVWVKRDDGSVSRIDPRTAREIAEVPSGYSSLPPCQGLTFDGQTLWTCAGENKLAAINPGTEDVSTIRVPRLGDQTRFVVNRDRLWVIGADAQSLSAVGLVSHRVEETFELDAFCIDLARSDHSRNGLLYAVCPTDGLVLAIDTETGQITSRLELGGPVVAALGRDLWVNFELGLAQVDPEDLTVRAVYGVTPGTEGSIWVEGDDVWVRTSGRVMLTHIDGKSRQIIETVRGDRRYPDIGDVVVKGNTLWTTASDNGVLLKLQI